MITHLHIASLCFDGRDEEYFSLRLSSIDGFLPEALYWHPEKPPRISPGIILVLCRETFSLFRDIPRISAAYPGQRILVLLYGLAGKIAALDRYENVWYADARISGAGLAEKIRSLARGCQGAAEESVTMTRREEEIYELIRAGCRTGEIASTLRISESTVNTHKHHLFEKFGVKSSAQMLVASASMSYRPSRA